MFHCAGSQRRIILTVAELGNKSIYQIIGIFMPTTDSYQRLPVSSIVVNRDERQRTVVEVDDLVSSVKSLGVLCPILVTRELVLIAGERRLEASRQAGLPDIPVRYMEDLSPVELQIVELEENVKRHDLGWADLVKSVGRIHALHLELDPDWTLGETADTVRLSQGNVSEYLKVAAELESNERVAKASTVREAYNILLRRDSRAAGEALQEILDTVNAPEASPAEPLLPGVTGPLPVAKLERPPVPKIIPAEETILNQSFLQWAPSYSGRKFNFIHCDFPYGVDLFAGPQSGRGHADSYSDTKEIYFELIECLCKNLDRLLGVSGHLMFWYSAKHHDKTMQMFRSLAPSLVFSPFPLIWVKSDNAGIASDASRQPRHIYETCLLAARGQRQIVKIVSDAYSAPTDKRFHVSTKPEPMLKHFMSMLVDESTSMLDPTCGGASSIRAAEELGAKSVLGMDIDSACVEVARMALRNSRTLRAANKVVGGV